MGCLSLHLDAERQGGSQDDLSVFISNADTHGSLIAITRHRVASHVGQSTLGLEAGCPQAIEFDAFIVLYGRLAVISVEVEPKRPRGGRGAEGIFLGMR